VTEDRKLAGREIDLLIHLLKSGGTTTPITILSSAQPVATGLWRLGLVNVWLRQSLGRRRTEGPFYSLTTHGRYRAEALMLKRPTLTARTPTYSELFADVTTPPPPR
jgi:hypothetical protein